MNKVLIILPLLVLALTTGPLLAQKDIIELKNGKKITGAKVQNWTPKEITFKKSGRTQTRPATEVKRVVIKKVEDALKRADGDASALLQEGVDAKERLVGCEAFFRAAMLFQGAGEDAKAIETLLQMQEKYPDSPYAPEYYRTKIHYYINNKKLKNAGILAEKYKSAANTRSWSRAFALDAEFYDVFIQFYSGKIEPNGFINEMKDVGARANESGVASFVHHACLIEIADTHRRAKKNFSEARAQYKKILAIKGLSDDVRARAYIGCGYVSLEDAVKDKKHYETAFRSFISVFTNASSANVNLVAEGLYNAAKAADQWNGMPDCRQMAARLRGRLKRAKYSGTKWAKKK